MVCTLHRGTILLLGGIVRELDLECLEGYYP